eukprot:scaffold12829_cov176-Skeletonema_menzelii.AAC.1
MAIGNGGTRQIIIGWRLEKVRKRNLIEPLNSSREFQVLVTDGVRMKHDEILHYFTFHTSRRPRSACRSRKRVCRHGGALLLRLLGNIDAEGCDCHGLA